MEFLANAGFGQTVGQREVEVCREPLPAQLLVGAQSVRIECTRKQGDSPYYILAGYSAPEATWAAFWPDWQAALQCCELVFSLITGLGVWACLSEWIVANPSGGRVQGAGSIPILSFTADEIR